MGIIYSAAKTTKQEAWEIGKNYYRLEDLFPPCAFDMNEGFQETLSRAEDVPDFVKLMAKMIKPPVRMEPGRPVPFVLTDLYPALDDFITRAQELKGDTFTDFELPHWKSFYTWAENDPIVIVGELESWAEETNENSWVDGNLADYRFMDSWNGESGRKVEIFNSADEE